MTFKEWASMISTTSPWWGVVVSAFSAWLVTKESAKRKVPVITIIFVVSYSAILLSFAIYASSP